MSRATFALVDDAARRRAELRRNDAERWPLRSYKLGSEPIVDPLDRSTVDERIATMWPLARQAWRVSGKAVPTYARHEAPGSVIRGRKSP
jgi:hypothetical protein